jgi:geranylgeranyl pyrophosphate synthase/predicted secreted hydrolase
VSRSSPASRDHGVTNAASYPSDWPGPGPIDLGTHDPPHASSTTEWWYVNAHLTADDGRAYSLFAAFFALAIDQDAVTKEYEYAYSVAWGLVDVAERRYVYDSVLDTSAPRVGLRRLDRNEGVKDPRAARALREVFERGSVPLPDRMFERPPKVAWDRLALDFDDNRLERRDDGSYELALATKVRGAARTGACGGGFGGSPPIEKQGGVGCRLVFTPRKAVVRHGQDGVVRGSSSERMFYYFTPSCDVAGTVTVRDEALRVRGRGWYDHEFGTQIHEQSGARGPDVAWNWLSAQLDDGWEISLYQLLDPATGELLPESGVIAIAPDGHDRRVVAFTLTPLRAWTSTRTFNAYPTRWSLEVPELDLSLVIDAELDAQEFVTIIAPPAFWEGRVRVAGVHEGRAVTGLGFVERSGLSHVDTMDGFFSSVGETTRDVIRSLLPDAPSSEHARTLFAAEDAEHWVDGVDLDQYWRTVVKPVREIVDRGGKTWRSYGLLACIDAVGGDSDSFRNWLALPELLHTGSLIVDDVQDGSDVRRGGPAAHRVHGTPLAINAGTACYFIAELTTAHTDLPQQTKVDVYRWFFAAARAAHAGQALDIDGLRAMMPAIVESGDGAMLERRIRAIHRLKSGAPPGALARIATRLGDGTPAQEAALANLFEAYGVAFQIVDDVLNLRGFRDSLKTRGEDLAEGKVTAPVAQAMSRLPLEERRALWQTIDARPSNPEVIERLIATIEGCGALQACEDHARAVVEEAWSRVEPLLPDSHVKMKLRTFGWFILDRHY